MNKMNKSPKDEVISDIAKVIKYDDYSWHINDSFPSDLSEEAALTHMGMFIGWVIDKGFEGELLKEDCSNDLYKFRERNITGAQFIKECCDYKLISDDLNEEANRFAEKYYESGQYYDDYANACNDNNETIFHEADNWENYEKIKNIIENRYKEWKKINY